MLVMIDFRSRLVPLSMSSFGGQRCVVSFYPFLASY